MASEEGFELDQRLADSARRVIDLPLSRVLLSDDANYPWLILVPRRADVVELLDLEHDDRQALIEEIVLASRALRAETDCDKLNVAALGNQVPQLHVHIIARFKHDAAWPGPVWGKAPPRPWQPDRRDDLVEHLRKRLSAAS